MPQPIWNTPAGTLGTYPASTVIALQLSASAVAPATTLSYSLLSGALPPDVLISDSGLISGTLAVVAHDTIYGFAVRVTDNLGNIRDRTFTLTVTGASAPSFTLPAHEVLFTTPDSIWTEFPVPYSNPITSNPVIIVLIAGNLPPGLEINDSGLIRGYPATTSTTKTYYFTLELESLLGTDIREYSITVTTNLNRSPTIFNTRPATYRIATDIANYGYYILPPDPAIPGETYAPNQPAFIGQFASGDFFAFRILGYDFDNYQLEYVYNFPPGLGVTGDSVTGWITGTPQISYDTIAQYAFSVYVRRVSNTSIQSPLFNFTMNVSNNVNGTVTWITPADLGQINNATTSTLQVQAMSDVALNYRLVSGALPPNLTVSDNGEIIGTVAYEPTTELLPAGTNTSFTFAIEAYSPGFASVVNSTRTFSLGVYQDFTTPTDTLYMSCTPSAADRNLINSLLNDPLLIPDDFLYRPDDPNFGKATEVVYEHAYGVDASNFNQYVAAVTENHYWRNITLGQIQTAVARDNNNNIIYEVVFSKVIDNLVNPNYATHNYSSYVNENQSNLVIPYGVSIPKEIVWPRPIPLDPGPGSVQVLYPNSLNNMRQQVEDVLGDQNAIGILPNWMSSQQRDGSTLGFTPAWVIAYCLPGTTTLPDGTAVSYAQYIQYQIQNNWINPVTKTLNTLNTINFKLDRFSVNKSITYDYDSTSLPPAWTELPSASPPPDPVDADDFYVLFPYTTILPE